MFCELLGSVVWCLSLIRENSCSCMLFPQIFLLLHHLYLFSRNPNYVSLAIFDIVPQLSDVLFVSLVGTSLWYIFISFLALIFKNWSTVDTLCYISTTEWSDSSIPYTMFSVISLCISVLLTSYQPIFRLIDSFFICVIPIDLYPKWRHSLPMSLCFSFLSFLLDSLRILIPLLKLPVCSYMLCFSH